MPIDRMIPAEYKTVPFEPCPHCSIRRICPSDGIDRYVACKHCNGIGYLNVPTSDEAYFAQETNQAARIVVMCARYTAGMRLYPESAWKRTAEEYRRIMYCGVENRVADSESINDHEMEFEDYDESEPDSIGFE